VGPRAGLDNVEKRKFLTLPGLELLPLSRPARSQSLYRLRYPGSYYVDGAVFIYFRKILRSAPCSQNVYKYVNLPFPFLKKWFVKHHAK
jgi:hypothetical protein